MIACLVPGCAEPYLTVLPGGWAMCQVHRERERRAGVEVEHEHQERLDEYDPAGAAMRREDQAREQRELRMRAFADVPRWEAEQGSPYGVSAFKNIMGEIHAAAIMGSGRNDAFSNGAYRLGQLIAGGELNERDVVQALDVCVGLAAHSRREHNEFRTVVNRRLQRGMENPRSAPVRRAA